jgi:nucleoside-diphosphate-sugar epimerase
MKVIEQGEHLNVYHIGTNEEVSIEQLAKEVAVRFEREIKILPGVPMKGSALRRCPDISKLRKLGYEPKVEIKDGLRLTTEWYIENSNLKP